MASVDVVHNNPEGTSPKKRTSIKLKRKKIVSSAHGDAKDMDEISVTDMQPPNSKDKLVNGKQRKRKWAPTSAAGSIEDLNESGSQVLDSNEGVLIFYDEAIDKSVMRKDINDSLESELSSPDIESNPKVRVKVTNLAGETHKSCESDMSEVDTSGIVMSEDTEDEEIVVFCGPGMKRSEISEAMKAKYGPKSQVEFEVVQEEESVVAEAPKKKRKFQEKSIEKKLNKTDNAATPKSGIVQANSSSTKVVKPAGLVAEGKAPDQRGGAGSGKSGDRAGNSSVDKNEVKKVCSSKQTSREIVALDCEFVGVGDRGSINALARCSVVDYHGKVLLDIYSRPEEPITDYRTRWSGIRPRDMWGAVPFENARRQIRRLVEGKIIVGHAIHNDLEVLQIRPAPFQVRDTVQSEQLRQRMGDGLLGLKHMANKLLGREIQTSKTKGHCSIEDARASLDLFKLVEKKWDSSEQRFAYPVPKKKKKSKTPEGKNKGNSKSTQKNSMAAPKQSLNRNNTPRNSRKRQRQASESFFDDSYWTHT